MALYKKNIICAKWLDQHGLQFPRYGAIVMIISSGSQGVSTEVTEDDTE